MSSGFNLRAMVRSDADKQQLFPFKRAQSGSGRYTNMYVQSKEYADTRKHTADNELDPCATPGGTPTAHVHSVAEDRRSRRRAVPCVRAATRGTQLAH